MRRREALEKNSFGRRCGKMPFRKMPTGIFKCAAGKRWKRIRLGGVAERCRFGKCRQAFLNAPPGNVGKELVWAALRKDAVSENADRHFQMRRRETLEKNSFGRRRGKMPFRKMPTGIFKCAAGKRWKRTRLGGVAERCRFGRCRFGKCRQAFLNAPPGSAGKEFVWAAAREDAVSENADRHF